MQLVETVVSNAKFHSSQDKTSQSTVTNVFQSINQHLEEVQVAEDLAEEVEALAEDLAGGRGGSGGRGGFNRGPREMHKATCGDCGKDCEVPFEPRQDKPVYCSECFQSHKN